MSFILDALKKSEAERQRQAGPTLLELRITRPRRRYPLWALVVGVLLAVNIAVLLIFLLNRPPPAAVPSTASTPGAAAAAVAAAPASGAIPAAARVPALVTPDSASNAASAPGPAAGPTPGPAPGPAPRSAPASTPAALAATSAADEGPGATGSVRNPADYAPALPPGSQPRPSAPASPAGAVDYSNLPSISQISGNVPAMQLDLLISSDVASERYALIDMHRVREGDVLPDGARVLAIMPNGVAMDYRGQDFLLRPGGTAQ